MALAHAIGNKVEAAYRRGDLLEKRTQMMADWAQFCHTVIPAITESKATDAVTDLPPEKNSTAKKVAS
jgi:hypothetical protein